MGGGKYGVPSGMQAEDLKEWLLEETRKKTGNASVVKGGESNSVGVCKGGLPEELTWVTMVLLMYGEE